MRGPSVLQPQDALSPVFEVQGELVLDPVLQLQTALSSLCVAGSHHLQC